MATVTTPSVNAADRDAWIGSTNAEKTKSTPAVIQDHAMIRPASARCTASTLRWEIRSMRSTAPPLDNLDTAT